MERLIQEILEGNCVVYPTSTLPALGCILTSDALDNLYLIKNRAEDMIVSIAVSNIQQASNLVYLTDDLEDFIDAFPEGSITIILRAKKPLDKRLGGEKIAIRILSNETANASDRIEGIASRFFLSSCPSAIPIDSISAK